MSKRFIGSIDLTALGEAARANHPAITKGNNGRTYANITLWENDAADQYGNTHSIQLQQPKDSTLDKVYIGRAKPPQVAPAAAVSYNGDSLPF